jgi:hypothetical protein
METTQETAMPLTRIAGCVTAGAACGFGLLGSASANPPVPHLDLRPPMNYSAAPGDAAASAHSPTSGFRRSNSSRMDDRILPPALGTDDPSFTMMSRSALFVGRVRREGLPFARLWESKSALLSIGLDRKGKPGIWLTQKVR